MDVNETSTLLRADLAPPRPRARQGMSSLRPARAILRLIAYVVDWLVTVIAGSVLVSVGGLQLYIASGRGRHDAPDGAIYAFLIISVLVLPVWLVMTLAWWAAGRSAGKLALGLRIVDQREGRPGLLRAAARLFVYALENAALLAGSALLAVWIMARGSMPAWTLPVALLLLLAAALTVLPALGGLGGRPLHDRAAGTLVIEE